VGMPAHKAMDIFRLFNPNRLSEAHSFRRQLAIRVSESLSDDSAAPLALQLQGLLRAVHHIEDTFGGDGTLLVSDGTAWRQRLATLRQLERMRRTGSSSAPRLDATIVELIDNGRLTFEITSVLNRRDYDAERTCAVQIARSEDCKSWVGPVTAEALQLITKVRAMSVDEPRGIQFVLERFQNYAGRSATSFVSALVKALAESHPAFGPGTSRSSGDFVAMIAALVALPKFAGVLDELKFELWSKGYIASIAEFEHRVMSHVATNDKLVGTLATAVTLPRFYRLGGATAEELLARGLIECADEFLDKVAEREHANQAFIEAVAAVATLHCYRDIRRVVVKELLARGKIESSEDFEVSSDEFEYWTAALNGDSPMLHLSDSRNTKKTSGWSSHSQLRAHPSVPATDYAPSGLFALGVTTEATHATRARKSHRNG